MRWWHKCYCTFFLRMIMPLLLLFTFFFNSPSNIHVFLNVFLSFSNQRWAAWSGCVLASPTSSSGYSLRSRWTTFVQISCLLTPPAMKSGRAVPLASCWSSSCCWGITWMRAQEMPSRMALTWVLSVRWVFNFNTAINYPFTVWREILNRHLF